MKFKRTYIWILLCIGIVAFVFIWHSALAYVRYVNTMNSLITFVVCTISFILIIFVFLFLLLGKKAQYNQSLDYIESLLQEMHAMYQDWTAASSKMAPDSLEMRLLTTNIINKGNTIIRMCNIFKDSCYILDMSSIETILEDTNHMMNKISPFEESKLSENRA